MKCDEVMEQLLSTVQQFKEAQGSAPFGVIVPSEMFARIRHKLTDLRIDKNFQRGCLGSLFVRSDDFVCGADKIICYTPPEPMDLRPEDFLPVFTAPEVAKLREHIENAKKKEKKENDESEIPST